MIVEHMASPLGEQIRLRRKELGLTLDEVAGRTGISKPYLSLIETGRVTNPPSDEKLRRIETALGFAPGMLVTQAHIQRTPVDVRNMLRDLLKPGSASDGGGSGDVASRGEAGGGGKAAEGTAKQGKGKKSAGKDPSSVDLDKAFLSGALQRLVDASSPNVESVSTNVVPVVNKVAAGYPTDFTDMSYPRGVADAYIGAPDVEDRDAFAARVHGDSMQPKYVQEDIVIFSPAAAVKSGDDCFVRLFDGHTTFKRVFFEADAEGSPVVRLQPRNEKYPPKVVPQDQVIGIHKAVYRYQSLKDD